MTGAAGLFTPVLSQDAIPDVILAPVPEYNDNFNPALDMEFNPPIVPINSIGTKESEDDDYYYGFISNTDVYLVTMYDCYSFYYSHGDPRNDKGLYNSHTITNYKGDFDQPNSSYGSAQVHNYGTIENLEMNLLNGAPGNINNNGGNIGTLNLKSRESDFTIFNSNKIDSINVIADQGSGHIVNIGGYIANIKGDFYNTKNSSIFNAGTVDSLTLNFKDNQTNSRSILNLGKLNLVNSNFINNRKESTYIDDLSNPGNLLNDNAGVTSIGGLNIEANDGKSSIFEGNQFYMVENMNSVYNRFDKYLAGLDAEALKKLEDQFMDSGMSDLEIMETLGISPDVYDSNIAVNIVSSDFIKSLDDMDMDMEATQAKLTLTAKDGGKVVMNDKIRFVDTDNTAELYITGDKTGAVYLNDNIESLVVVPEPQIAPYSAGDSNSEETIKKGSVNLSLDKTNLILARSAGVLDGHKLKFNSGAFSLLNGEIGVSHPNTLTIAGNTDFYADVDLANKQMDRIEADTYGKHTGDLSVTGMNLLSDATDSKTEIYFAQEGLKDNVTTTVTEVAYTPIYKYNVRYENRDDAGYFVFDRGGSSSGGTNGGNPSDAFNPAVLSSPVSSVAAAQATINETFKYVFEHADAFTQMPYSQRMAQINSNKYAISTDFNGNRGSLCYDHNNKAAWFRPYATFETMNLKNGPKVNATTYGSLAGFDTDFFEHKNGWHSVGTGYIGYNGSQLSYKGVDTTMNGGILGYTHTMYKGNFWTALTLSAGASVGESRTMYGKEDFTSLMAGVGSKTGYNFEFKEGKYILQPIMFMSYTFVNTFDYTNAAGVKINADPAHSIQLNPSIRFISNFKNGWQPYASVGMVWNVMNENNVTANNVRLPEMSMKPYVEYGVGVQRNWKDKFTAFGQAMLRNGGRNGIALTAGFRWALGKDTPQNHDKVQTPKTDRTVLKQLTPQQKMALTGKKNTTITSAKAVLKQL